MHSTPFHCQRPTQNNTVLPLHGWHSYINSFYSWFYAYIIAFGLFSITCKKTAIKLIIIVLTWVPHSLILLTHGYKPHICALMDTHTHTITHVHTYARTHTHTLAYIHIHTYTHTHTHTQAHARTQTHT